MERPDPVGARGAGLWLEWERAGARSHLPLNRPLSIGRDPSSDVCLTDPTVSLRHAVVSIAAGRPHIDASTSTNGIALDQGRTNRATLSLGQSFRIGDAVFRVVAAPAIPPQPSQPVAQATPPAAYAQTATGPSYRCPRCQAEARAGTSLLL